MEFKFHFSCLIFLWHFQIDCFLRHFKKDLNIFLSFVVSLRERNYIIKAIVFQTMLITEHVYGSGLPPRIKALLYWFILEKENLNQHE